MSPHKKGRFGKNLLGLAGSYARSRIQSGLKRGVKKGTKRGTYKKRGGGKKVALMQRPTTEGAGGTKSSFFYGKRIVPRSIAVINKKLAKNYFMQNGAARLSTGVGLQNFVSAFSMFGSTDDNLIRANVSSNTTAKIFFESCSAELMISNRGSANARVFIYDIIARRDAPVSTNVSDPATAWTKGGLDEGLGASVVQQLGNTPFQSDLFTQYYKVLKITNCLMGAGTDHTHRVHYSPNKQVDGEVFQYATNNIKGLTCYTMVLIHGLPENDTVTNTQVSTGRADIDYVFRKQYKYTWMADDVTNAYFPTNNLPGSFTIGEQILNIATGTILGEAAA